MLTVTRLAKKYGISRAAVLYYERKGLILPKTRSNNGYRWYGDDESERLQKIIAYRSYGMPVVQILKMLDRKEGRSQFKILEGHLHKLENEIDILKEQQKAIVALLQEPKLLEQNMVTKERWIEIMEAAGFDDKAMITWHKKFEEMEPEEHQKFLESLGIDAVEINYIRNV